MALAVGGELVHQAVGIAMPRTVEAGLSPQAVLVFRAEGANPSADFADFARDIVSCVTRSAFCNGNLWSHLSGQCGLPHDFVENRCGGGVVVGARGEAKYPGGRVPG